MQPTHSFICVYNTLRSVSSLLPTVPQVQITLSTHDCGGLSQHDITLATFIDQASVLWGAAKTSMSDKRPSVGLRGAAATFRGLLLSVEQWNSQNNWLVLTKWLFYHRGKKDISFVGSKTFLPSPPFQWPAQNGDYSPNGPLVIRQYVQARGS